MTGRCLLSVTRVPNPTDGLGFIWTLVYAAADDVTEIVVLRTGLLLDDHCGSVATVKAAADDLVRALHGDWLFGVGSRR